jgi:phage baseplate assembly protein W
MLNNRFYTLPIEFSKLKAKKAHTTCDLKASVAQYIHLITTTYLGEFSIDPDFGCSIWDFDFDNTITDNALKEGLKKSLSYALNKYERRIHTIEISVTILQTEVGETTNTKRIKKRIEVVINAVLMATNEKFDYFEYFYLGPLSYY